MTTDGIGYTDEIQIATAGRPFGQMLPSGPISARSSTSTVASSLPRVPCRKNYR